MAPWPLPAVHSLALFFCAAVTSFFRQRNSTFHRHWWEIPRGTFFFLSAAFRRALIAIASIHIAHPLNDDKQHQSI
jgi:hypothetical protein